LFINGDEILLILNFKLKKVNKLGFFEKITEPIFYVTNDVSRGIGIENLLPNYHIVCLDDHPLVNYLIEAGIKVFCLERVLRKRNKIFRSTSKIIDHPLVLEYIKKESKGEPPNILFFKPSAKVDFVCQKYGFLKIGNSAKINRIFEDKVNFYEICRKENLPVPEGETEIFANLDFQNLKEKYGLPLVIQFGRGWAGNTTFFIDSDERFSLLKRQFGNRKVKVTQFIFGKTILNNACIYNYNKKIFISPPAQQIEAIPGLTSLPAATCGRQWPVELAEDQIEQINRITRAVGKIMVKNGYKGFFGLDFIVEQSTGKIFLSENNARLTASVPFFTKLEIINNQVPLLLFHLAAFLDKSELKNIAYQPKEILGSEVVARNDQSQPVKIEGEISPGVYRYFSGKLIFQRKEYWAKDLKDDEFWMASASKGRIVNPEQELLRVNFGKKVVDSNGRLEKEVGDLAKFIKKSLELKNVKA